MILIFLLSNDAKKWVIRTDQISNSFEGYIGRDKTRKLINEAIEAGYVRREKYLEKNMTRIKYYISEEPKFKKCYRRPDFQGPESRGPENQSPLEGASSQERASEETTTKKKKERATPFAAVSFDKDGEKKKEPAKPKTYECLEFYPDVGDVQTALPRKEKIWITKKYDEETAKNAILWAQNETKPFYKGLVAAIKWACKERPQIAKNAVDQKEENRAYALKYDGEYSCGVTIEVLNKYVCFNWTAATPSFCLEYTEKGFKEQFIERLRRHNFTILE